MISVALFAVIVVAVVLLAIASLLLTRKSTGLKVLGVAVIGVPLLFFLFVTTTVRMEQPTVATVVRPATTVDQSLPIVTPGSDAIIRETTVWNYEVEEQFDADIYSSGESAAKSVGRRLVQLLKEEKTLSGDSISHVYLVGVQGNNIRAQSIEQALAPVLSEIDYSILEEAPKDATKGSVTISLSNRAGLDSKGQTQINERVFQWNQGTIDIKFVGPHTMTLFSASYVDKPWVNSFDSFSTQYGPYLLVGRSHGFASSEQEATRLAMSDARMQLRRMGRSTHWIDQANADGRLVMDHFLQKLTKPYGNVWRAAYLIDLSPETNRLVSGTLSAQQDSHSATIRGVIGTVLLFGLLITGLYALLNSLTRGYYRTRIIVALVLVTLGGLALLIA